MNAELCVENFLKEAERLGVEVRWQNESMHSLDAAYHATPGQPGEILLTRKAKKPSPVELCTLISHEMVHVLQHWSGDLHATPLLCWPTNGSSAGRKLSRQERGLHRPELPRPRSQSYSCFEASI
ncbi:MULTISPECIES: hypothetical protein [unclassified Prochlorococcus]|uniref:hypothetical protein n=1 Tax=unclassified Prochlorococcus TaxID=2627481 RepID=UPI00055BDAA5|nr:hypothetical protein [Prochlorococcus sp. MIT 0701]